MIHHLVLLTTKPEVIPTKLEEIMVETRIRLLKIGEVNNLRVGKRVDTEHNPHPYFFSFDVRDGERGLRPVREADSRAVRRHLEEPRLRDGAGQGRAVLLMVGNLEALVRRSFGRRTTIAYPQDFI
jgi:hypothetical protein